jgi:hypothetical protein
MPAIAGVATVVVDGVQYPARANVTVSPTRVQREMIPGQDYVHGYRETVRAPFVSMNVSLRPEVSSETLEAMTSGTVQVHFINGNSYVLTEAVSRAGWDLDAGDGQATIRWDGTDCQEMS